MRGPIANWANETQLKLYDVPVPLSPCPAASDRMSVEVPGCFAPWPCLQSRERKTDIDL